MTMDERSKILPPVEYGGVEPQDEGLSLVDCFQVLAPEQGAARGVYQTPNPHPNKDKAVLWERLETGNHLPEKENQGISPDPTTQDH